MEERERERGRGREKEEGGCTIVSQSVGGFWSLVAMPKRGP